jgi:hypothetical protein
MKTKLHALPAFISIVFIFSILCSAHISMAQEFPDAPAAQTGKVTVSIIPAGIASGWHFVGEPFWRESGSEVTGLVLGERQIEYRPAPNFIQPINETITLTSDSPNVSLSREYYSTPGGLTGSLTVRLKPDNISAPSVPQASRAQWRLLGEGDSNWTNSGRFRNLPPGVYLIESKPISGTALRRLPLTL